MIEEQKWYPYSVHQINCILLDSWESVYWFSTTLQCPFVDFQSLLLFVYVSILLAIPIMINRVCEKSLMYSFQQQKRIIDDYMVKYVIEHEMLAWYPRFLSDTAGQWRCRYFAGTRDSIKSSSATADLSSSGTTQGSLTLCIQAKSCLVGSFKENFIFVSETGSNIKPWGIITIPGF